MYCPKCGSILDPGANFCTACGEPVDPADVRGDGYLKTYSSDGVAGSRRSRVPVRAIAIAVIAVVVVLAVVGSIPSDDPGDGRARSYTIGDLTVYGDLYTDSIVAGTSDGQATLTYTGQGVPSWYLVDECATAFVKSGSVYATRDYQLYPDSVLTISTPGKYGVMLSVDGGEPVSGTVVLDGEITVSYSWLRPNGPYSYSFDFTYQFSEFLGYEERDAVRYDDPSLSRARFVVVDEPILRLEAALAKEYETVQGTAAGVTQDYADYLLSFVQTQFDYPDPIALWSDGRYHADPDGYGDMFLNGSDEYWSFPMETVHLGMGDCEDTSFLLCALYSAAGFISAIVVPPGHMMVGVSIDGYVTPYNPYRYASEPVTYGGSRYYLCETTFDFPPVPAGLYDKGLVGSVGGVEVVMPSESVPSSGNQGGSAHGDESGIHSSSRTGASDRVSSSPTSRTIRS